MGLIPAYIVTGTKNVQKLLSSSALLDSNFLQLLLMDAHWGFSPSELAKFAGDHTSRGKAPPTGIPDRPKQERYWLGYNRLYAEYLSTRRYSDALATSCYQLFCERLDASMKPNGECSTTHLFTLLRTTMAEAAIVSLFGPQILDLSPGFVNTHQEFDDIAGTLVWCLPKILQRRSVCH